MLESRRFALNKKDWRLAGRKAVPKKVEKQPSLLALVVLNERIG
jgi:hypothetical protein